METQSTDFPVFNPGEYEKCRDIMLAESDMIAKISSLQILVKNAVTNRAWADFECLMASLEHIRMQFEALDAERVELFEEGDRAEHFYTLCSRLPPAERETLADLYRRLKMDTFKIKLENDALLDYINEARIMVAGFLEAIFPERKGRIYSRQGTHIQADMRSLVLNKTL